MAFTRLQIATMVESISLVTTQRPLVNQAIQISLNRVAEYYDFPYYIQDKGVLTTVASYGIGTVAIVAGGTTATVTTGVVSATFAGMKIRFAGQNAYYRILSVNTGANTLTLQNPYQGVTLTTGTYLIYQDEYRLNADIDKYKMLRQAQNSTPMFSYSPADFDAEYPMPNSYADPTCEVMEGTLNDVYTTGTLSGSVNTSVLTGVTTSWLSAQGVGRLSQITIGTNVYTVKSVDSDTQITLFDTLTAAIALGTTYSISMNNLRVQLSPIPNAQRNIYYRYFRQPTPLLNDTDLPDMPYQFHWMLMYGALSIVLLYKGDMQKAQDEAEKRFVDGLTLMVRKLGSFTPDRTWLVQSQDRIRSPRGSMDGIEAADFDRRYSS